MLTATLEELSNQRRSKKIGDGAETKVTIDNTVRPYCIIYEVTELDMLQRQQNKEVKD